MILTNFAKPLREGPQKVEKFSFLGKNHALSMDARELGWLQLHNSIWPRGLVIVVSFRANLGTWTCKQLGTLP